jgi:hypothetical protein
MIYKLIMAPVQSTFWGHRPGIRDSRPCSKVHHATCESEEVGRFKREGSSSLATWRMSSTAVGGCRPDAAPRTHQTPQARPGPGWAHEVLAAAMLHVGHRRRYPPAQRCSTATNSRGPTRWRASTRLSTTYMEVKTEMHRCT